jgi:hypothetical protein
MKAQGTYKVTKWEENPYDQISVSSKLSKASVEYQCSGEIEGKAIVEYLMFYSHSDPNDPHNSSAEYVGFIRFQGKLKEKPGSFVLHDHGTFQGGTARSALRIATGSGTGALQGITGTGKYRADREGYFLELDYDLP